MEFTNEKCIELINGNCLELLPTFKTKEFDYFFTSVPFKENEFGLIKYWENMDFVINELKKSIKV
jgi:hypothetical protein